MTSIMYIRHGQQTNFKSIDPPIKQYKDDEVKIYFDYDIIISSPYLRCRQTANIINKKDVPIYIDTRLSEFHSTDRLKTLNKKFDTDTLKYGPISLAETWEQFTSRVENFHTDIFDQLVNKKVLVVTHGLVVKHLEETILGNKKYLRGRDVPYLKGFII